MKYRRSGFTSSNQTATYIKVASDQEPLSTYPAPRDAKPGMRSPQPAKVKGKRVREQFPEGYFERTPSASRNMASKGLRFPFLETPAKAFSAVARGYPRFISAESTSSSTAHMAGTAAPSPACSAGSLSRSSST